MSSKECLIAQTISETVGKPLGEIEALLDSGRSEDEIQDAIDQLCVEAGISPTVLAMRLHQVLTMIR